MAERVEWVRVPISSMPHISDMFEHTAFDWRKGEYPRILRPPGPRLGDHKWRWERRPVQVTDIQSDNSGVVHG